MGHSQAEKLQSRERILKEAADQIRVGGFQSVSVGKLMKSVNLTHGGFYGHFKSRTELLTEALKRAVADSAGRSTELPARPRGFAAFVRNYLSRTHRDSRRTGCAVSALVCDIGRADVKSKALMAGLIEDYIAATRRQLSDEDDTRAMFAISAMVGALALSRVMTDVARSDALLSSVCEHLLTLSRPDETPSASS